MKFDNINLGPLLSSSSLGFIDPMTLRRVFVLFARELYSDANNYGEFEALKDLLYTDNRATRTLDVDLDFVYDTEEISKKPAVYVGTGNMEFKKQVTDNFADKPADGNKFVTMQTVIPIIIKHIGNEVDVSLTLGSISTNFFAAIRDIMFQEIPGILSYEVASLSQPSLIEGSKIRAFQTNLTINLAFSASWHIVDETHKIKSVSVGVR